MSTDDNGKSNLFSTRASGELRERLEEYIENSEESKSQDIRDLLDRGLQVSEGNRTPDELRREIEKLRGTEEELRDRINELEAEKESVENERKRYKNAAWMMTLGLIGGLMFTGQGGVLQSYVPPAVSNILLTASGLMMFSGFAYHLALVSGFAGYIRDWRE